MDWYYRMRKQFDVTGCGARIGESGAVIGRRNILLWLVKGRGPLFDLLAVGGHAALHALSKLVCEDSTCCDGQASVPGISTIPAASIDLACSMAM